MGIKEENQVIISGWIKTAQDEFTAYKIIQKSEPDYRILFRQKYNALCQSLELALKAFLISKGLSVKDVKAIGHDLIKLIDTARTQYSLMISPKTYGMIMMLNPTYKSRQLLYFEKQYALPSDINILANTTRLLISKITFDN
ncbi:MAG: hypothetical protein UR56_C0003G0055 [Candidatus Roizmanbacteria bacterium GW2011_GWC2_34_23]|uniref:HEPN domain-containing protein n=1 Tax=Candidatus Roizmanbacteria bacterium GW2011_GWC2_34_23 TaxID=1618484 RepID=A0A0G0B0H4_9BACT|nr:MAG: hypothetical protein UR15_C0032G0007 [Parcubacteria group bacterium GW2011_GWA2_31_28]KKP62948.1 MAG: hypothetical protein UR56_C0003G0055 [Candidatus Roizmanbacteria bacterium GW2011_GWC2_34_23]